MAIHNLTTFLADYFTAHHCEILSSQEGMLTIQLTEEMDRALMNRPFYWHYVKKMGRDGDPIQLTLITNQNHQEQKGERIHFGSPRLQQILTHLRENERFTRLFQVVQTETNTALHPWLLANIKISYIGKQNKDELFSIGLNLVNGLMKTGMMDMLKRQQFHMQISDYCYTIAPLIKLKSGYKRIESVINQYIHDQNHAWAEESLQEQRQEVDLLTHFYQGDRDHEVEQMEKELQAIKERYQPKINVSVVNGGLVYLEAT